MMTIPPRSYISTPYDEPVLIEATVLYRGQPYYLSKGEWFHVTGEGTIFNPYNYVKLTHEPLIEKFNMMINAHDTL